MIVDANLKFTILVYGWTLPKDNFLYEKYQRTMRNVTVSLLLKEIKTYIFCEGFSNKIEPSQSIEHTIPQKVNLTSLLDGGPTEVKKYFRARDCSIFLNHSSPNEKKICDRCDKLEAKEEKERVKKEKKNNTPAKRNAPLSKTHRHRVELPTRKL